MRKLQSALMAIFLTKYTTAVTLVVHPGFRHDGLCSTVVCALFGVFIGYFLGCLVRNLRSLQQLRTPTIANSYATADARPVQYANRYHLHCAQKAKSPT
jgi:hypothetical protein